MSLGTYGTFNRTTPRLRVRVGWAGDARASFVEALPPVASSGIISGMAITKTLVSGVWSFQKATSTRLAAGDIPYFANGDATDPDVVATSLILGLSCNGKFVLETAYYDAGTYTPGVLVTVSSAVAGNVMPRTSGLFSIGVAQGIVNYLGTTPNLEENSETDGSGWTGNVLILETAYQPVIS